MLDALIQNAFEEGVKQAALDFGLTKEAGKGDWATKLRNFFVESRPEATERVLKELTEHADAMRSTAHASDIAKMQSEIDLLHAAHGTPPKPVVPPAPPIAPPAPPAPPVDNSLLAKTRRAIAAHPLAVAGGMGAAGMGAGALIGRETAPDLGDQLAFWR